MFSPLLSKSTFALYNVAYCNEGGGPNFCLGVLIVNRTNNFGNYGFTDSTYI